MLQNIPVPAATKLASESLSSFLTFSKLGTSYLWTSSAPFVPLDTSVPSFNAYFKSPAFTLVPSGSVWLLVYFTALRLIPGTKVNLPFPNATL